MCYLNDGTLFISARRALADARQLQGAERAELLLEVMELVDELKTRAEGVEANGKEDV